MSQLEPLQQIREYMCQLLQQKFGRDPQDITVYHRNQFLVLYINGFVSPMEDVLFRQGQEDMVFGTRLLVIENLMPEMRGVMQISLGVKIADFYQDWNYHNDTGMILAVIDTEQGLLQALP